MLTKGTGWKYRRSALFFLLPVICSLFWSGSANAQVDGLDTLRIRSQILDDSIIIFKTSYGNDPHSSITYVLDGEKILDNGFSNYIQDFYDKSDKQGTWVYISTITADSSRIDKRQEYFTCNNGYLKFIETEVIPLIEGKAVNQPQRTLIGVSFGGMFAAYASAHSSEFDQYVLLSPITYLCDQLHVDLAFSTNKNLDVFMSSGRNDAEVYTKKLIGSYKALSSNLTYIETEGGHDFENWKSQMGRVLNFIHQ